MWIAAFRLEVKTYDSRYAGTDDFLQAVIVRDDHEIKTYNLDNGTIDDHEPGDERTYTFRTASNLPLDTDQTLELQPGVVGPNPMPYPPYGFEFSNDLAGHLVIRMKVAGTDMWQNDRIDLEIKQFRVVDIASGARDWAVDVSWSHVKTWNNNVRLSRDTREGQPEWDAAV